MHRYALALESEKEKWHLLDKDTAEHVKACSELAVLQGIADFEKSCVVHGGLNGWYDETWKASDHAMAMRSLRLHRGEDSLGLNGMYIRKKEHQIQFFRRKQKFLMTFRQTKQPHTLRRKRVTE